MLPFSFPASAQSKASEDTIRQLQQLREAGVSSADAIPRLQAIQKRIAEDAPYALQRELIRTELAVFQDTMSFDKRLANVMALRHLAESNGDTDTMNLMDIARIVMTHADDDIDKFITQLNDVRARITPDTSVEVKEALERTYGNLYFDAGNFESALRHQLSALDLAERLPRDGKRARMLRLVTIAELYNAMELPERALDLVDRGFALADNEAIPPPSRISLLSARSMALLKLGRTAEAEAALVEAETLSDKQATDFVAMRVGTLRTELLLATSRPEQAIKAAEGLAALALRKENTYFIAKSTTLRGEALMQLGKLDEGLALMQQGINYFKSKGQMVDLLASLDQQITLLRRKKLFESAIARMDERGIVWSQLFRNERGRAIAEVEAAHTAESLERRIDTLSAENRAQQARIHAERLSKALAAALALLAITLSVVLFLAIRRTRRERDVLSTAVRFDVLTSAYSRYQFQRRDASDKNASVGLLLLDLDNFKATNDRYGHEAGDEVLKRVVGRIREVIAEDDEVYRWGGEEFLIVLNSCTATTQVEQVTRILSRIEQSPVTWHDQLLPVRVSGGYVQHPLAQDWNCPLVDAIRWVDAALYLAKNSGRGRIEQVTLSEAGAKALKGRRPLDMAQLLDWQRHGYLVIDTIAQVTAAI
ncbi:MAG: tetratricopeptide repeat-containing diguanylate cyclase [Dokdonella sp.]